MKKFCSFLLKSALVLCILGVLLLGIGFAVGGTTVAKDGIHLSLSKLQLDLLNYLPSLTDKWEVKQEVLKDGKDELSLNKDALKSIDIDAPAVHLVLKTDSTSDDIKFSCESSKAKKRLGFTFDPDDGIVKVRPKHHYSHLTLSKAPTVTITLPKTYTLENLDLDLANCSVKMDGILHIVNCKVDIAAGNFEAKNVAFENLTIDTAAGNVDIALLGKEEDYNFIIDCAVGNLTIGSHSENGFANEYKYGTGKNTINIDTAAGNVDVRFMN
ncbi:Putative adhesin [Lachnospiraceae bacterium XBB1006]|nr:Putative adhesin [Lachnospiraceae bacterium XBB1006]